MTGEGILQQDLVISKLLRQDIDKYRSIFPHVSAAIQLSNNNNNNGNGSSGKYPTKGDIIQYIYTNSQHDNLLCRVVAMENLQEEGKTTTLDNYDKEKYREMALLLEQIAQSQRIVAGFHLDPARHTQEDLLLVSQH